MAVESIPIFSALAWSPARDQKIAIVNADRQRPSDGSGLVNRSVLIDGKRWFCTAVDRDVGARGPIMPRERIFLWVRKEAPAR